MSQNSSVPLSLRTSLLATAIGASAAGVGVGVTVSEPPATAPSAEVLLAMEIGGYYEGLRLTPYRDGGGIWTVCRGITGAAVVRNKRYTESECKRLELAHYTGVEREARKLYTHWDTYNIWVQASMLDMLYNLGAPQISTSTHVRLANAGNLPGACAQMLRWVWGRDVKTGLKVQWQGLKNRRATTEEICSEWGRDGHFSVWE